MKNPNQDLIDVIRLNELRDLNDECVLPQDEKDTNAMVIERELRARMNRLRLKLTPEQVEKIKEEHRVRQTSD